MRATQVDIAGAFNARAFGGDRPWLVRTSNLDAVVDEGASVLRQLGVTTIVDLRSHGERIDPELDADIVSVPLYEDVAPVTGTLEDVYRDMLEHRGAAIAAAVSAIADADGAALVHCAVGKDRTGLVVALVLLAVGVDRSAVVADYVRSGDAVAAERGDAVRTMLAGLDLAPDARAASERLHLTSPAEALETAIDLVAADGGAVAYLQRHGLDERELARLRAKAGS